MTYRLLSLEKLNHICEVEHIAYNKIECKPSTQYG